MFLGKKIILGEEKSNKKEWQKKIEDFNITDVTLTWNEVQEVLKSMRRKYSYEEDHASFERFYVKARDEFKYIKYKGTAFFYSVGYSSQN